MIESPRIIIPLGLVGVRFGSASLTLSSVTTGVPATVIRAHACLQGSARSVQCFRSLQHLWMLFAIDHELPGKLTLGRRHRIPSAVDGFVPEVFERDGVDDTARPRLENAP